MSPPPPSFLLFVLELSLLLLASFLDETGVHVDGIIPLFLNRKLIAREVPSSDSGLCFLTVTVFKFGFLVGVVPSAGFFFFTTLPVDDDDPVLNFVLSFFFNDDFGFNVVLLPGFKTLRVTDPVL
jgi:hypothetical protein